MGNKIQVFTLIAIGFIHELAEGDQLIETFGCFKMVIDAVQEITIEIKLGFGQDLHLVSYHPACSVNIRNEIVHLSFCHIHYQWSL